MTTTEPVDWALAERVAVRLAARHADAIPAVPDPTPDFERLGVVAEALVASHTGLVSAHGPARIRVVDRAGWIAANIGSFRRLLAPLLQKYAESFGGDGQGHGTALAISRRVGRCRARLPVGLDEWPGPRPVRPPRRRRRVRPGHRLRRGAESRLARAPLRLPARGVPPLVGAPRAHPPCPVHGSSVDAGLLPRAGRTPRCRWRTPIPARCSAGYATR